MQVADQVEFEELTCARHYPPYCTIVPQWQVETW